jgi:hypothetical protein
VHNKGLAAIPKSSEILSLHQMQPFNVTELLDDVTNIANIEKKWLEKFSGNIMCLHNKQGSLYLYHARKAAGTTVREILEHGSRTWRVPYYETEGLSLKNADNILNLHGLVSVTTLRDPIKRILSLYWYEHVGWFDGILHQTHKCKSMRTWVNGWKDGNDWKTTFMQKNPNNVYVEIENYYVKMLTGWRGPDKVTSNDLEKAKQVLADFDIVLIMEWMNDESQIDAINFVFPGRNNIATNHHVKGDKAVITRLQSTLAPDNDAIVEELTVLNKFDIELYEYAKSMAARRLKLVQGVVDKVARENPTPNLEKDCNRYLPAPHDSLIGIFRPPGHKGPFR